MKKRTGFFDKAYLSRVVLSVSATLIALGVLFYLGYHTAGNLKSGIDTFFARSELFDDNVECRGYILRNETALNDPYPSAYLSPTVKDGGRVSVGGKVADVYTAASDTVCEKISILEEQIAFYEKCRDTHATIGDSSTVKRSIADGVLSLRRTAESGSFKTASADKKKMLMNISSLGVMTGKITDFNSRITELSTELSTLRLSLGSMVGSVYSPTAGYYFAECDGYESVLSSKDIDTMTYSAMAELLASADSYTPADTSGSAGKVMHDFKWYVACPMSSTDAARLSEGYSYPVTLSHNDATPLTMKLSSILTNATDAIAIFECTTVLGDFDYTRVQEVSVTVDSVPCFEIPVSAARCYEGMRGVYILDQATVKFRKIEVFDERNGKYLCYTDAPEAEETPTDETTAPVITTPETAAPGESAAPEAPVYLYLRENDIVIKGGVGLEVGMTYDNKR